MNKTQFKNHFGKYFTQIIGADVLSIKTDKTAILEINVDKSNRKNLIHFESNIKICEEGILDFTFILNKETSSKNLETILPQVNVINEINLYEAKDEFCKEQALQFRYNENSYFYILIYTDMVESTLEFFEEQLTADKFKKVAF